MRWMAGAALAVGLVVGGPAENASALGMTFTYSGTITSGVDALNEFGGGDLTGQNFTFVQQFSNLIDYGAPYEAPNVDPKNYNNAAFPFDLATFTTDNRSFNFSEGFTSVQFTRAVGSIETYAACKSYCPNNEGAFILWEQSDFVIHNVMVPDNVVDLNGMSFHSDIEGSFLVRRGYTDTEELINFDVNLVEIKAAPLPASLPLFTAGLLALGALAYRKRLKGAS